MLLDNIKVSDIQVKVQAADWEDAIRKSAALLLSEGAIEPSYVDAMIQVVKENGPYIVISKHIALAHAQSRHGVKNQGLSFTLLEPAVCFGAGEMDPVKLIITLAATDPNAHIDLLSEVADVLSDAGKVKLLFAADSREQFLAVLTGRHGFPQD